MDMLTIAAIALLVFVTLWWVLKPLWQTEISDEVQLESPQAFATSQQIEELLHRRDSLYAAIKDLEQDLASDKINQQGHDQLRRKLTHQAAQILQQIDEHASRTEAKIEQDLDHLLAEFVTSGTVDAVIQKQVQHDLKAALKQAQPAYCPNCQNQVGSADAFCSQCGTGLNIRCPQCQASVLPSDHFCAQCGTNLIVEGAS